MAAGRLFLEARMMIKNQIFKFREKLPWRSNWGSLLRRLATGQSPGATISPPPSSRPSLAIAASISALRMA
jgi:hypothetical protein